MESAHKVGATASRAADDDKSGGAERGDGGIGDGDGREGARKKISELVTRAGSGDVGAAKSGASDVSRSPPGAAARAASSAGASAADGLPGARPARGARAAAAAAVAPGDEGRRDEGGSPTASSAGPDVKAPPKAAADDRRGHGDSCR